MPYSRAYRERGRIPLGSPRLLFIPSTRGGPLCSRRFSSSGEFEGREGISSGLPSVDDGPGKLPTTSFLECPTRLRWVPALI